MVNLCYYSLAVLATGVDAKPWNFSQTHELARGTHTMPEAYDPNYAPIPKRRPTIFSTQGQCKMNPWIFLALIDSNYSDDEKFGIFGSRDQDGKLVAGNGETADAMWMSLINCKNNAGIQKLMALDAMANHRPDVMENIFETTTDATGTQHQVITKETLFEDPLEFYKNYWQYNYFTKVFHSTGYGKWYKINELFKIAGKSINPVEKYRDRKYLMQNLDQPMMAQLTRPSRYLPRFSGYTPSYNTGYYGNSWSRNNFMSTPQRVAAPPASGSYTYSNAPKPQYPQRQYFSQAEVYNPSSALQQEYDNFQAVEQAVYQPVEQVYQPIEVQSYFEEQVEETPILVDDTPAEEYVVSVDPMVELEAEMAMVNQPIE